MRGYENRLKRALEFSREERIIQLRDKATEAVLPYEVYVRIVGQISELKRLRDTIPELCERILEEEDDDEA